MPGVSFWDTIATPQPAGTRLGVGASGQGLQGTTIGTDAKGNPIVISPEGPLYAPNEWDEVYLGAYLLPGICTVKGTSIVSADVKKPLGVDGATITVRGYMPASVEIEMTLWTPAQWTQWQKILPFVWRPPGKPNALGVQLDPHLRSADSLALSTWSPALNSLHISNVVVVSITTAARGTVPGSRVIRIKCLEYVNVKPTNRTATVQPVPQDVPLAQPYQRKNAPPPPSTTDAGPGGPSSNRVGGAV